MNQEEKPVTAITRISSTNPDFIKLFSELYGHDEMVLNFQFQRYLNIFQDFSSKFSDKNPQFFSSPGRTEIGGNHTDHNHGRVLAGAVNLDNVAVAARNCSDKVRIISAGYPDLTLDLSDLNPREDEQFTSIALVKGIIFRMDELGYKTGGFDAVIDGGVPKGSGLSSSASYEVLIGTILNHLFNEGKIDPIEIAVIGQFAENHYFGKPCGLMDQTACSSGGLITIDFENPEQPVVRKINFNFISTGYALVITDTGGNHANLNEEYASIPREMKSVAAFLGSPVLRGTNLERVVDAIPEIRAVTGDRAILRAFHFHGDNQRVAKQVEALENNDFKAFLLMVIESGNSSFMYNQNIYPVQNVSEQGVSLALALSEMVLKDSGAWRVHGGGFAGTIQAFVPLGLLENYVNTLEHVFGKGSCNKLFIRGKGAIKVDLV